MINQRSVRLFSFLPLLILMFSPSSACNSMQTHSGSNESHPVTAAPTPRHTLDLKGTWGGRGISMEVSDDGAEITYDCAQGSITGKIVLDSQGHFSARGHHLVQRPGPTREGDERNEQPATYRGSVSGDQMTLTVTLSNAREPLGPFTLTHGRSGRLTRCA
jgi:hypothetical protein